MLIYCVLGDNRVDKSLSPVMHNAVFSQRSIGSLYVPFAVPEGEVGGAVQGIRALGIAGANVTVPHKETIIPFLDALSDEARTVGAVNTIVRDGQRLVGHNTDVEGFGDFLKFSGFTVARSHVLLLGAGGASRAVLRSLINHGAAHVTVANRTYGKSLEITRKLGGDPIPIERARDALSLANLLVNATSVSESSSSSFFSYIAPKKGCQLHNLSLVVDINYGREKNLWALFAEKHNARFMDGLYMLAAQARRSFMLWTGEEVGIVDFLRPIGFSDER